MLKLAARLLVLYFGIFVGVTFAAEITCFGPEKFIGTKDKPNIYTVDFQARAGTAKILVTNGDADGSNRLSSAVITLNGSQLLRGCLGIINF